MSDTYTPIAVKTITDADVVVALSDGTDTALVAATGELLVTVNTALPAGGNNIGDVDVLTMPATAAEAAALPAVLMVVAGDDGTDTHALQQNAAGDLKVTLDTEAVDTELAAAAALSDAFANPTTAPVGAFLMGFDGTDWERVRVTATGQLHVDIQSSITLTVDSELAAAAALSDAFANPTTAPVGAFLMGFDGTDWERIYSVADGDAVAAGTTGFLNFGSDGSNYQALTVDAAGHLQVDVLTGGGTDSPTNPTIDTDSSTNTAAGSPADLDSAEITEAEKLWQVVIAASVPFKVQIKAVEDGTPRNLSNLMFAKAGETIIWEPPHRDFAAHAGAAAGLDVFRATVTNMDNTQAADLHAAFLYST
jgi:hypothetical protein